MPIVKDYMNQNFWQMDKEAFKILTHNAIIVYLNFVSVNNKFDPTDKYMAQRCNMSLNTYKKAKKELIDNGYIYVERKGAKGAKIVYHFGKNAVKYYFKEQDRILKEKTNI
jgi:hypothetical protein